MDHIIEGATEEEKDYLVGTALGDTLKDPFLADVLDMNTQLCDQTTKKVAAIKTLAHAVKGGRSVEHAHTETGHIQTHPDGSKVIIKGAIEGYVMEIMTLGEGMIDDLMDVIEEQNQINSAANASAGEADALSGEWLDDAAHNELDILADFLAKGFAFHVDTTDFVSHTTHPYAPFSTGAYNELVDQINGFEQFFHYWRRTRERSIDTLASCKNTEKEAVSVAVFGVDIPALEKVADDLLILTAKEADNAIRKGEADLTAAKAVDTAGREHLENKVSSGKATTFREIGFMVKKLYRATREEYKHTIKQGLEASVESFADVLTNAREELETRHKASIEAE